MILACVTRPDPGSLASMGPLSIDPDQCRRSKEVGLFGPQEVHVVIIGAADAIQSWGHAVNILIGNKGNFCCPQFKQNVASGREPDAGAARSQGYT
jgi:hypothetical protein